jgi:pilus assembly protein Flp/PilA
MEAFKALFADESGQGLVEYSLIIALVAIAAIIGLQVLGTKANTTLVNAAGSLS